MTAPKKIQSALISVYYKNGLAPLVEQLHQLGVQLYSTGGTEAYIRKLGIPVTPVEDITSYPSIFGGRVKTLHPAVMGGILYRRDLPGDGQEAEQYKIPPIDMVIVDLYPFEETVAARGHDADVIEKIDIGGISLIRAAAKNHNDVLIVPSVKYYDEVSQLLAAQDGVTSFEDRRLFAARAFEVSSHYDAAIFKYFDGNAATALKVSEHEKYPLRYGETHIKEGLFMGNWIWLWKSCTAKNCRITTF